MEEQIKKLQEELELVKKERDSLILEKNKTFIKTRLNNVINDWQKSEIKDELVNKNYINAMYKSYNTQVIQELIDVYGFDLVLECFYDLCLGEEENE